jgi:hypothetical protein
MFDGWKVVVDEEIGRKEGSWIEIAQHLPQVCIGLVFARNRLGCAVD